MKYYKNSSSRVFMQKNIPYHFGIRWKKRLNKQNSQHVNNLKKGITDTAIG